MRIAHNLVIDHFRRNSAENLVSGEADGEGEPSIFDTIQIYDKNVEDEMIEKQVYADLVKLVDSLPEAQREVLKMRFYQDLSFKEIAEATGVSINTALGRMRYALINLRTLPTKITSLGCLTLFLFHFFDLIYSPGLCRGILFCFRVLILAMFLRLVVILYGKFGVAVQTAQAHQTLAADPFGIAFAHIDALGGARL